MIRPAETREAPPPIRWLVSLHSLIELVAAILASTMLSSLRPASARSFVRSFTSSASPFPFTAAVARSASGPFSLETLHFRPLRPEEIRVKVVASGVCHTDIVCKERGYVPFPMVMGHEGAGVVESVGSSVNGFAKGDHVLLSYASCGTCPHCAIGKPSYCYQHGQINFAGTHLDGSLTMIDPKAPNAKMFGSFFQQSSFATHAIVTANNTLKVAKNLDLNTLAPLGCGVQTGAGAVLNSLSVRPGDSIGIWGCGAVGLSAILAAKVARASKIVAVDLNPNRLAMAKEFGATHTLQVTGKEAEGEVAKFMKSVSEPGLQYALDTSGNKHALRAAFDSLRPMGTAALIGGSGDAVAVPMGDLLHGRSVRGIVQGDSVTRVFLPKLIDLWQAGEFPFHKMLHFYSGLEKLDQAFKEAKDANGSVIKPVIKIANP